MYDYQTERANLFTDEGQRMFLKIRDRANDLLQEAGAFSMAAALKTSSGDSWQQMACVDRMAELGEIVEVGSSTFGQFRIFTFPPSKR